MPASEEMLATIDSYRNAVDKGDLEAWIENFAPDATMVDPVGQPPRHGHADLRAMFELLFKGVDGVFFDAEDLIVCGTHDVAMVSTFLTRLKSGATVRLHGVHAFTFDDDAKFKLVKVYWDPKRMILE